MCYIIRGPVQEDLVYRMDPGPVIMEKCNTVQEPPVLAPFENLDTICANDWWNR